MQLAPLFVIPAKGGIRASQEFLNSRLRANDIFMHSRT